MKANEGIRNITNRMEVVQSLRNKLIKTRLTLIAVITLLALSSVTNVIQYNKAKNIEPTVVTKEVVVKDVQEVVVETPDVIDTWVKKQLGRDSKEAQATSMTYAHDVLDSKDLNKQYQIGDSEWTRMFNYGKEYAVVVDYKINDCDVNYMVYIMDIETFVSGDIDKNTLLLNQYISKDMDYIKKDLCLEINDEHNSTLNNYEIEHIVSK